jgi:hypothetical protein
MKLIHTGEYARLLYDNHAGTGKRADVSGAILKAIQALLKTPEHVPTAAEREPVVIDQKADAEDVLKRMRSLSERQPPGSLLLTVVGETHRNDYDSERARTLIGAITDDEPSASLIVFERGMTYPHPASDAPVVTEESLTSHQGINFGLGLHIEQRSMVVAGYLVVCLASGDQRSADRVVLFYGERHADILSQYFDYFARHTSASHLLRRERTFLLVRSSVK